jgi:tRNA dimethylallyltransferase
MGTAAPGDLVDVRIDGATSTTPAASNARQSLRSPQGAGAPARPMSLPEVIAIFGPTGSGKTAVAEALSDELGTEVVATDAMQVYEGLPILTNQPDRPTRLVGIWPLSHEGSVGEFVELAHAAIDELVETHGAAVVAGGTGLYLRAALADLELRLTGSGCARALGGGL